MPFRIALSGLNAATADLKATANNVANASTTGFKASRAEFVDVFAVGYGGISSTAIGGGVRLAAVKQQFSQGNVDFTDNNLDLAINGQGFFVLNDKGAHVLSRAGAFSADRDGYVVNSSGQHLQIFPATVTSSGTSFDTGRLTDLQLSTNAGTPKATDAITSTLNLDASEAVPVTALFSAADPTSYNRSTSLAVYDSLGAQHTATQYFVKTAPNSWQAHVFVDGTQMTASPKNLVFTNTGAIDTVASSPTNGVMPVGSTTTITAATGASEITMNLDVSKVTQYGSPFAVSALQQTGYATGRLSGIDIGASGVVSARYTNGQSQTLGKLALGNVPNPQGLSPQGNTVWGETYGAGDLILGEAGTGSFGLMQSGALEASNVDTATELVNLITAQRNFQANAQVITTANAVTQTIINIR